jgi:hypothetical protein
MTAHPYRASDDPPPRFVCVSCYRTASLNAGNCSRCSAPRVPLDGDEVRDDLRAHVVRAQQRAAGRRLTLTFVAFTALAIGVYVLLVAVGVVDAHQPYRFRHLPINEAVFFPLWLACLFGGGFAVDRVACRRRPRIDAATARIPELLGWIGVQIEADASAG